MCDVEAWGKLSESVAGMLVKDANVRVVGRLKQETFTKGKRKYSRIKVVAEHIEAAPGQKASCRHRKRESILSFRTTFLMDSGRHETKELKAVMGPGDKGEPVLTVMLPNQD